MATTTTTSAHPEDLNDDGFECLLDEVEMDGVRFCVTAVSIPLDPLAKQMCHICRVAMYDPPLTEAGGMTSTSAASAATGASSFFARDGTLPQAGAMSYHGTTTTAVTATTVPTATDAGVLVSTGVCGHSFHTSCVREWQKAQIRCPLCESLWREPNLPRAIE